ncbi:unnamed protein product [Thelazia callipaeda]|uniref:ZP domain-containing protein n=1 Tax=Thelazia callipaeda TaxID=103827 RepID=A0A158RAR4_THECL|nr:unnamed protein product [Thelazia callipaeda]
MPFWYMTPSCDQQTIKVVLTFNENDWPQGQFEDWIIVGTNNRAECRLKGNGELQYVIELAVFNDPCETQMPSTGVFQNRIRIGKNPAIILFGDKMYIIKCIYGLPEISQLDNPSIKTSFNAVTLPDLSANSEKSVEKVDELLLSDHRMTEIEESQTSEDSKRNPVISWTILAVVMGGLFVIIFILMLAFICFRWKMEGREKSLHAETVTSNGITVSKFGIGDLWWNHKNDINSRQISSRQVANERCSGTIQSTVPMSSSLSSKSSTESGRTLPNPPSTTSFLPQKSSMTDFGNNVDASQGLPRSYSEWRNKILSNIPNKISNNSVCLDRCSSLRRHNSIIADNQLSEVRSITEIYRSAETTVVDGGDTLSQSTLEGVLCSPHYQESNPIVENLIKCVGKIRGIGARKLTEQEFGRWRRLVISDASFCEALSQSRGIEQIESLCFSRDYKKLFSKEKWNAIIRCIVENQTILPSKYTKRCDLQQRQDIAASSLNVYIGDAGSSGW